MKVNVSLDDDLLTRIDNYADKNYMSRSAFISLACVQYLSQVEVLMLIKDMSLAMRKIADTGTCDQEILKQLEDFQRFSEMFIKQ